MEDWKSLYKQDDLRLGYDLYHSGEVSEQETMNKLREFYVDDKERTYIVILSESNGFMNSFCLSCGRKCRHQAAVMYYLENQKLKAEEEPSGIPSEEEPLLSAPIFEESRNALSVSYKDPYSYYDFNAICEEAGVNKRQVREAEKLIEKGKVKLIRAQRTFISSAAESKEGFRVEGKSVSDYFRGEQELSLLISGRSIVRCSCYSCGYYSWEYRHQICEHLLALLMLFEPYIRGKGVGDATTRNAAMMLAAYRSSEWKDSNENVRIFHVKPRLIYGKNNLSLGFKGGFEKMYVIRNMMDLVMAWKNRQRFIQSNIDVDFSAADLDCTEDVLFQMAVGFAEDRGYEMDRIALRPSFESLPLTGSRLDQFFEEKKETSLPITWRDRTRNKNTSLKITAGSYRPKIILESMEDSRGGFEGIQMEVFCTDVLYGISHLYVVQGDYLIRLDEEAAAVLKPMLKVIRDTGSNTFQIGRSSLSQFFHRVLPVLKIHCDVQDHTAGKSDAFIPPSAQFCFYLDCNTEMLFANAKVIYDDEEMPLKAKGGSQLSWRDQAAEDGAIEVLRTYFPNEEKDIFFQERNDDSVYLMLSEGADRLAGIGEVQLTDRFSALKLKRKANFRFGVSIESNVLDLELLSEDISPEELLEVLNSFRQKKKYHRLRNGEFISLEESRELESLSDLFDTMHISLKEFIDGKIHIPAYRALYLDKMLEEKEAFAVERRRSYRDLINNISSYRDNEYEVPSSLKGKLRPYQEEGFQWLTALKTAGFAGVLADDMGLGKTVQMIAVLAYEKQQGSTCHSLIVTPASLIYNWAEEFRRFAPELSVQLIAGGKKERRTAIENAGHYDVNITSYDLLKRDIHEYENQVFDYEVLDEAQYIKTPSSEAAKSTKIIHSLHRFALTGTPIENRLSELWSIFDFLMPGFLYSYDVFRRELEGPITAGKDEIATARLRRMVSPFILRRLKETVLTDLPDKLEETVYTRFEDAQKKLYDGQVVKMKRTLAMQDDSDFTRSKIQILAELTRLREICCDPHLLYEDYRGESAKREALYQLMDTAMEGGHKMLVFSQFASMLEIIEKDLSAKGIPFFKITGATPKEERIRMVSAFNGDETPVFLISLKAGGTGLNLTGADTVIHFDPWWNLAAMNQASDRAHRIGQTKTVTVYRIIVKDTVEDRIVQMQEEKRDLANAILSGESGGFASMSREDLLDILG